MSGICVQAFEIGDGVGYSNYLKMAEDWLDGERFTAEEFFWLETKFGLIEL